MALLYSTSVWMDGEVPKQVMFSFPGRFFKMEGQWLSQWLCHADFWKSPSQEVFFFNFFHMDWILRAWGQATRKSLLCWKTIWRRTGKDECLEWTCFSVIQPENWMHGSIPGGSRGFILRNKILTLPFISFCVDPMQTGDRVWHSQDRHKSSSQHWNLNTSVRCAGRSLPEQPASVRETLF